MSTIVYTNYIMNRLNAIKNEHIEPIVYENGSTKMFVYDKYIVAEVGDSIDIYKKEADFLKEVASKHFEDRFGLIDNRINNVSINPDVYNYIKVILKAPRMTAFALVSNSDQTIQTFPLEKVFIDEAGVKNKLFYSLDDAKDWISEII